MLIQNSPDSIPEKGNMRCHPAGTELAQTPLCCGNAFVVLLSFRDTNTLATLKATLFVRVRQKLRRHSVSLIAFQEAPCFWRKMLIILPTERDSTTWLSFYSWLIRRNFGYVWGRCGGVYFGFKIYFPSSSGSHYADLGSTERCSTFKQKLLIKALP
jgi:hypothetical protein